MHGDVCATHLWRHALIIYALVQATRQTAHSVTLLHQRHKLSSAEPLEHLSPNSVVNLALIWMTAATGLMKWNQVYPMDSRRLSQARYSGTLCYCFLLFLPFMANKVVCEVWKMKNSPEISRTSGSCCLSAAHHMQQYSYICPMNLSPRSTNIRFVFRNLDTPTNHHLLTWWKSNMLACKQKLWKVAVMMHVKYNRSHAANLL